MQICQVWGSLLLNPIKKTGQSLLNKWSWKWRENSPHTSKCFILSYRGSFSLALTCRGHLCGRHSKGITEGDNLVQLLLKPETHIIQKLFPCFYCRSLDDSMIPRNRMKTVVMAGSIQRHDVRVRSRNVSVSWWRKRPSIRNHIQVCSSVEDMNMPKCQFC